MPCGLGYVDKTAREVRVRLSKHKSALQNNKANAPPVDHFIAAGHGFMDFRWFVIETIKGSRRGGNMETKRKNKEQWYISVLDTVRKGLNTKRRLD